MVLFKELAKIKIPFARAVKLECCIIEKKQANEQENLITGKIKIDISNSNICICYYVNTSL